MKDGNWIALDKKVSHLLPHGRAYTELEALISFTIDIDNDKPWTIKGYASQWTWSRNKVRRFIDAVQNGKGHQKDTKRTLKGHHISIKINNLQEKEDTKRTLKGHQTNPYYNPNTNPKEKPCPKKEQIEEIISYLNQVTGKKLKHTAIAHQRYIKARLKEGFTVEDFKTVIDTKSKQWLNNEKMNMYLRPETLFGTSFDGYLNETNHINNDDDYEEHAKKELERRQSLHE